MTIRDVISDLLQCENLNDECYAHLVWREREGNSVVEDLNCPISFIRVLRGEVNVEMGYKDVSG